MRNMYWLPLVLFAVAAWGQQPERPLTLADCIRLANTAPSPVTLARLDVEIASRGVNVARSSFLPHAGLTGGAIYNTPRPDSQAFVSFNGAREYITQAGVGIELDTSGRLRAAYARSRVDRDIAQTGVRISERDLRRAVTIAYFRVLAARRSAEAAAANLLEARSFEDKVRALVTGGEAAKADLIKASAQVAAFDQLKRAADLDALSANQELASFWTADADTHLPLEDTLTQPAPEPKNVPPSFLTRPEFRLLDLQKEGFRLDAKRERAALLPQITLGFQYGLDARQYLWRERGTALVASLNVPIFDWFRARNLAGQFALRAQQVDSSRNISERVFSKEYLAAKARVDSLVSQVTAAETQVNLSQENLKLSRVRYEGGEGPALDVVLAQMQLQQARVNHFNTLFQLANARADLEVASGR